jgi:hypothetical protein
MCPFTRLAAVLALLTLTAAAGAAEPVDPAPPAPVSQVRVMEFRNYGYYNSLHLSPDGKTVASVSGGNGITLFELDKKPQVPQRVRQPRTIVVENAYFNGSPIAFSPDGKTLVGVPQQNNQDLAVRFWDVASGKEIRQIDNDQMFTCMAWSPDGKLLALGGQQKVELWDAATGDEVRVLPLANSYFRGLAFSGDGRTLATVGMDQVVHLWEVASGKERFKVRAGPDLPQNAVPGVFREGNSTVGAVGLSRDGRLLAVGGLDGSVRLWDLASGRELPPLTWHQAPVRAIVFLSSGEMVSFDSEGLKLVWSTPRIVQSASAPLRNLDDKEFESLWDDLGGEDTSRSYRALRHLGADARRAVPLLSKRLEPVPAGATEKIAQLIGDLQSPSAGVRRKAMAELRNHGEAALGALAALSPNQPQGQAVRIMQTKLEAQYATPERARALLAVQVLERLGTPEANQLLEKLAKGAAGARLTVSAKGALERLANPTEPALSGEAAAEELWNDLASDDAVKAFRAVRGLASAPKKALPLLSERLKPAPLVDQKRIDQLIAALESDDFTTREKATEDLGGLGELAAPALKKAASGDLSAEARKRVGGLLERLSSGQPAGGELRVLRALEVLEWLGTDEAATVLGALAKGAPEARQTRDARASLERRGAVARP